MSSAEKSSAANMTNESVKANNVDPVQTAQHCLTQRFLKHFSRQHKQIRQPFVVIIALRVKFTLDLVSSVCGG